MPKRNAETKEQSSARDYLAVWYHGNNEMQEITDKKLNRLHGGREKVEKTLKAKKANKGDIAVAEYQEGK